MSVAGYLHLTVLGCGLDATTQEDPSPCPDPHVCPDPILVAALCALPDTLLAFFASESSRYWRLGNHSFDSHTRQGAPCPFPHAKVQQILRDCDPTAHMTSLQVEAILDRVRGLHPQMQQRYPFIQEWVRSFPGMITADKRPGIVVLQYETLILWAQATRPPSHALEHTLARSAPTPWIQAPTTAHARASLARAHPVVLALFGDLPEMTRAKIAHIGSTACAIGAQDTKHTFPYVWAAAQRAHPSVHP